MKSEPRSSARGVRRALLFGHAIGGGTTSGPISRASSRGSSRAWVFVQYLGKLEVAVLGPVSEDAEKVAQIRFGVESVQLARLDQREEVTGPCSDAWGLLWMFGSNGDPWMEAKYYEAFGKWRGGAEAMLYTDRSSRANVTGADNPGDKNVDLRRGGRVALAPARLRV